MPNQLTLAAAGSGKTRGLIEHCVSSSIERRILVVTFTHTNQAELHRRISENAGNHHQIEVIGWFAFLLKDFARPFIPFKFSDTRVKGFNFEGRPYRYASGVRRFLDSNSGVYASELGRLAYELVSESDGALLKRLEACYDDILIDEVQDLSAYDWEIINVLIRSAIHITMVGDIRQSVLATNPRSSKNKQYAYAEAIKWFRERENDGLLTIKEESVTWRCRQEIASFSDSIFDSNWAFPKTISHNHIETGHDGVFLLKSKHLNEYLSKYRPQCLRATANSGKSFELDYMNFGASKGTEYERVLIVPTCGITEFVRKGVSLDPIPASKFYVAVTRAKQSVAIVVDNPGDSDLPVWVP